MRKTKPVVVGIGELLWDLLPKGREMGGAPANFAYHARALGADGFIVSRVGNDELGDELISGLSARGLDVSNIGRDQDCPTGTVSVDLDAVGQPRFTIHEHVAWDHLELMPEHLALARRSDIVCFGTLGQRNPAARAAIGGFMESVPPGCLRIFDVNLRQAYFNTPTIIDSLNRCDALKLNEAELPVLGGAVGMEGDDEDILAALIGRFHLRAAALTRGENGCLLLASGGKRAEHCGFKPAELVDTVGAGDAFAACFAMGLLAGESLEAIAESSNRLASFVCSKPGGMPQMPEAGIFPGRKD